MPRHGLKNLPVRLFQCSDQVLHINRCTQRLDQTTLRFCLSHRGQPLALGLYRRRVCGTLHLAPI